MTTTGRLFGAVTSSVKMAANSLRLKATDPEYVKAAKYFEGVLLFVILFCYHFCHGNSCFVVKLFL